MQGATPNDYDEQHVDSKIKIQFGKDPVSSTEALINEKIDNMKIESEEFGLKSSKSKDVKDRTDGIQDN